MRRKPLVCTEKCLTFWRSSSRNSVPSVSRLKTFKRHAVRDERLVTGQNPMSSVTCAGSTLEALEWFLEADFSVPRDQACKGTFFCGGMLFRRTLAPTMKRYVDEALFMFREEERFSRCMSEVLGAAGLTDSTYKEKGDQPHGNCN